LNEIELAAFATKQMSFIMLGVHKRSV
jgi:hypothetical protein